MYLIALIFTFYNYTSYYHFLNKISKQSVLVIPLCIGVVLFFRLLFKNIKIDYKSLVIFLILFVNILLSSLLSNGFHLEIYMLMGALFVALVVANTVTRQQFINCYVNLILVLAIYSLVATYIFMPMHIEGAEVFPVLDNNNRDYLDMYFSMALITSGVPRNCSFCREPGVYQVFLLIGLFFAIEHQPKNRRNILTVIVLLVTMLTTFSAISYITMIICIIMFFKKYSSDSSTFLKMIIIFFVAVLLLAVVIESNEKLGDEIIRTMSKWDSESEGESLAVRLNGITANLILFFEKPLFGNGLVTSWLDIIERYGYQNVTGTTFIGFAAFGVVFGAIMHYLLLQMCRTKSGFTTFIWFSAILLATLSQNLMIANLLWILLFYPFMRSEEQEQDIRNLYQRV